MHRTHDSDVVPTLMARFRNGDKAAGGQLVDLLYPELRRLAVAKMKGERGAHTWQPTVLVNELYLAMARMRALGGESSGDEKSAFLGLAGHIMKRLLIDHSRPLYRRAEKIPFSDSPEAIEHGTQSLCEVEQALSRLADIDAKFRTVVELRVFEGLTVDEIAAHIGCSPRTVASYWNFAKRWLEKELAVHPEQ